MKQVDFNKLKNSHFYKNYINYNQYNIDDFLLSVMILKDNNEKIKSYLHFIKKVKELTQIGLYYLKDYSDIIRDLGFIVIKKDYTIFIKDEIFVINGSMDIINMIKSNMTINMFLRNKKIKKLMKKI